MKIQVKDKVLTIRKWKGKDKRDFINQIKSQEINESEIMNTLVYSCIEEKDVALSPQEFKFVLSRIRAYSLGEEVNYDFFCPECTEISTNTFKITDILRPVFGDSNIIISGEYEIELGEIKNKDFYLRKIKENEIFDFLLRINKFNGKDSFTLEDLVNEMDDMDIDILQDVLKQYDAIRFKIDDLNAVKCECGHTEMYYFDEIPEFFPSDWFNDDTLIGTIGINPTQEK